jgi:hypothetical protein
MVIAKRCFVLIAAALVVTACSVSRLAYLNAPPLVLWYVGGYVDMSDPQKAFLRERLTRAMAWHRQAELPEYQRTIEGLISRIETKMSPQDVRTTYGNLRDYYHRSIEHLLPDFADFLLMIDASQVAHMENKFADDNRKMVKESVQGTPDDRRSRRTKRFVEQFEEWTGHLSNEQRQIISNRSQALTDNTEERLGDRRYRQAEILEIVRKKPSREVAIATLRKLFIDTESWRRPEYTKMLRERDEAFIEVVAQLSGTLTPEQRSNLQRKLGGYSRDISSITARGFRPST